VYNIEPIGVHFRTVPVWKTGWHPALLID